MRQEAAERRHVPAADGLSDSATSFRDLGVSDWLDRVCRSLGMTTPTQVRCACQYEHMSLACFLGTALSGVCISRADQALARYFASSSCSSSMLDGSKEPIGQVETDDRTRSLIVYRCSGAASRPCWPAGTSSAQRTPAAARRRLLRCPSSSTCPRTPSASLRWCSRRQGTDCMKSSNSSVDDQLCIRTRMPLPTTAQLSIADAWHENAAQGACLPVGRPVSGV